ncbi:hypothetical protein [Vibrio sp. SCSIO 43137]|uniref:hypothetical protein n=1 Tax=Vibrio sp. SCSIO 43137 TaxID=3021011 RepID=UPI0023082CAD|nr:hypothetical protein [Vibrio sp. SCSIO 43137]WCE31876.1 hypothetical protein PK654_22385 [Vibrio sp. SCSIO 43137]
MDIKERKADQVAGETSSDSQLPSHYYFYLLSFLGSLTLILLQPLQAKEVVRAHGWYTQPYIAPFAGLYVITAFSGFYLLLNTAKHAHFLKKINPIELTFSAISKYRTAIIISLFFMLYIASLSVIGFALSSLIFILTMLWISNLFNGFWVSMGIISVVCLVLIFRVLVNVWLPDVWLYSLFSDQFADFANMYL